MANPTLVRQWTPVAGTTGTTKAITGTATTAGDTLIMRIGLVDFAHTGNLVTGISGGGTWTKLGAFDTAGGATVDAEIWACPNASSVTSITVTVSATLTGGGEINIGMAEFNNMPTTLNQDGSAATHANTTNTFITGTLASGNANDLLIACACDITGGDTHSAGPTNSFTGLTDGVGLSASMWSAYRVVTATSSYSTGWTATPGTASGPALVIALNFNLSANLTRTATDAPTTVEAVTKQVTTARTATDAPQTAEAVTRTFVGSRGVADAPHTAEVIAWSKTALRTASEAPHTAESVSRTFVGSRTAAEGPTTAEVATRLFVGSRTAADAPHTAESITRALAAVRGATDAPQTAEVATRLFIGSRTATDAPHTAEVATRITVIFRTASDAPQTAESIARVLAFVRSATDAPRSTDAATRIVSLGHAFSVSMATLNRIFSRLWPVGAGMPIELDILSPTGVVIARLQGARQRTWQDSVADVGAWSFILPSADPLANDEVIRIGNIARFSLHGHPRFAGIIEGAPERVMASVNGESGEYLALAGRGGMALLDAAIVEPADSGTFMLPAAGLLAKFVALARTTTRATLTPMSIDFSQAADSGGTAWTDLAQYQANAGTRLLDLLRQAIAVGIEFSMDPSLVLSAFANGLGSHRESNIVFRQGYHIRQDLHRPATPPTPTRVIVQGKDGSTQTVVGTEPGGSRRESFLSVPTTSEPATLVLAGQQFLAEQVAAGRALTVPVQHGQGWGQFELFLDYGLGDWVALDVPNRYALESQRIVAYTVEETDGGDYALTLDFNAIALDHAVRLKRQIDAINSHAFLGGQ